MLRFLGFFLPFSSFWISWSVLFLVSGTKNHTNAVPNRQNPENIQNVIPWSNQSTRFWYILTTINSNNDAITHTIPNASPLTSGLKSSPIITPGIGPKPSENVLMYTPRLTNGMKLKASTFTLCSSSQKKYPKQPRQMAITESEIKRSTRRPALSTSKADANVNNTCKEKHYLKIEFVNNSASIMKTKDSDESSQFMS